MSLSCYVVYLGVSILLTVWLGHALHREGRWFLLDCLQQDDRLVDAVNHLLLVGFYLINFAWIALTMQSRQPVPDLVSALEFLTGRIGIVSALLGGLHMLNLIVIHQVKQRMST